MRTNRGKYTPCPAPVQTITTNGWRNVLKNKKIFCPSQCFCSILCGWLCTWSYSSITAGTSLPASTSTSFLCVHCTCVLSPWLGDTSQVPGNRTQRVLQPVDPAEMRAGRLVPSLLANEDITMLKWSENTREAGSSGGRKGIATHNTDVHAW